MESDSSFVIDTKPTYIPPSLRFDAQTTAKITGMPVENVSSKQKEPITSNNNNSTDLAKATLSKNARKRLRRKDKEEDDDGQVGPSTTNPPLSEPSPKSNPELEISDISYQPDSKLPSASEYEDSTSGAEIKSRDRKQRYFGGDDDEPKDFDQFKKCTRCKEYGHNLRTCPHMHCPICGALDSHEKKSCPFFSVCWRCGRHGHRTHDCKETRSSMRCPKCSVSHFRNMCPTYWQAYTPLKTAKSKKEPKIRMSCYNCASPSHFGDDCPTKRGGMAFLTGFRRDLSLNRGKEYIHGNENEDSSLIASDREEGYGEIALAGGPSSRQRGRIPRPNIVNGKKVHSLPVKPQSLPSSYNSRKRVSHHNDYNDSSYYVDEDDLSISIDKRRKLDSSNNYLDSRRPSQGPPRYHTDPSNNSSRGSKLPKNPISIPLISRINGDNQQLSPASPNRRSRSRRNSDRDNNETNRRINESTKNFNAGLPRRRDERGPRYRGGYNV